MTNIGYSADIFIRPDTNIAHYVYALAARSANSKNSNLNVNYEVHSKSLGTVIEIDGPSHYETYMQRPLGPTSMKHRHLRAAGYNLIVRIIVCLLYISTHTHSHLLTLTSPCPLSNS